MHIPITTAIQGLSLLGRLFHLDGQPPAAAGAKPGGSCISHGRERGAARGIEFSSAMQLQDLMRSVGERLSPAEQQQVGQLVDEGSVHQAIHLLQQFANGHAGQAYNAPMGIGRMFTYTPPIQNPL